MDARKLTGNLRDDLVALRSLCGNSSDILIRELVLYRRRLALVSCAAMIDDLSAQQLVIGPLTRLSAKEAETPRKIYDFLHTGSMLAMERSDLFEFEEVFRLAMSGFLIVFIDGIAAASAFGLQGFSHRAVSEPGAEVNQHGSQEAFTEVAAVNLTMLRRRLKTPALRMNQLRVGQKSGTNVFVVYLADRAEPALVEEVTRRLRAIRQDVVLAAAYLRPFLESGRRSLFHSVATTERPDTVCAKIMEGRVAVVVDGTPFALIMPTLFIENFQGVDDYCEKPYFATLIRIVKYASFFISSFLPGLYIAFVNFTPEIIPSSLLYNIASNQSIMPFSIVSEALIINLVYEIMREAGLRMPRPVGHTVSIVGSLVIGQAAVTAGLISAPMIMVVALTAISAYVIPSLYEPCALLRLVFILLGGSLGLLGITVGTILLLVDLTSLESFGLPYFATLSPLSLRSMRDVIYRAGWIRLQKDPVKLQDLEGARIRSAGNGRELDE